MRQLSKWAYIDDDNQLRIDVPILLAEMKVEDTPANRELAMSGATEALKDLCPGVPLFHDRSGKVTSE
jgi:hypothetical protein